MRGIPLCACQSPDSQQSHTHVLVLCVSLDGQVPQDALPQRRQLSRQALLHPRGICQVRIAPAGEMVRMTRVCWLQHNNCVQQVVVRPALSSLRFQQPVQCCRCVALRIGMLSMLCRHTAHLGWCLMKAQCSKVQVCTAKDAAFLMSAIPQDICCLDLVIFLCTKCTDQSTWSSNHQCSIHLVRPCAHHTAQPAWLHSSAQRLSALLNPLSCSHHVTRSLLTRPPAGSWQVPRSGSWTASRRTR